MLLQALVGRVSLFKRSLSLLIVFITLGNVESPVLWIPARTRSATRIASAELAKDERLTSFWSEWLFLVLLYRVDLFRLVLTRFSFVTTPDLSKNVSRDCHEHSRVMEMPHKIPQRS